ncbi:hypothetical protein U1Q18_025910 [Sarracenia purpurea var. burkii]
MYKKNPDQTERVMDVAVRPMGDAACRDRWHMGGAGHDAQGRLWGGVGHWARSGASATRTTIKGFNDSNADHPESSSSTDELNRALRAQSGSPISQSLNRGVPEQGTSQAAGKKAGKPIIDATSVTEGSRRRAQISASKISIKG